MEQQVNLYLQKKHLQDIENYLHQQGFIFLDDSIQYERMPIALDFLVQEKEEIYARFITLPNTQLSWNEWTENKKTKYRLQTTDTEAITFSYFGDKVDFHRVRFYYNPDFFEDLERKHPKFDKAVNQFFGWLKTQFEPIEEMPDFYQHTELPVEEMF